MAGWAEESRKKECFLAAKTLHVNAPLLQPERNKISDSKSTGQSASHSDAGPRRGRIRSTTVVCVRRNGFVVMAADGQVTLGSTVMKHSAKKLRRL